MSEREKLVATQTAPSDRPADAPPMLLHMPVDVRSAALAILALLASVYALYWAKAVFVPILLGVMASYALTPTVNRLSHWRIPRAAGAGFLLSAIVALTSWSVWSLGDDANALLDTLPAVVQKLRTAMRGSGTVEPSALAKVQQAAAVLEKAAEEAASSATAVTSRPAQNAIAEEPVSEARGPELSRSKAVAIKTNTTTPPGPTHIVIEKPHVDMRSFLWTGTLSLVALLGQTAIVVFITFFLLASGDDFRRKMVKLAGPTLTEKKVTVAALDEVSAQIQRYLVVQVGISLLVGAVTWLVFFALGLEHAGVWGVIAGITNLIPYLGAILVGGASALVAFMQFGTFEMGLLVGASSFAIHTVIGNLLTPWWLGRAGRINPFAVFVSVVAFGWLWGVAGLVLGVPLLMAVKSVCDRVEDLKPIGELLGD